ncbi:MAG: MATE family efflux transporter [Bacillota bacterium]
MSLAAEKSLRKRISDNKAIRATVMRLAWPVMAESFLQTFAQIVSMALVGHLGASAVTSIGLSMAPLNVFYGLFTGLGVAVTAIVARFMGAEEERKAAHAAAQGVLLSAVIAVAGAVAILVFARDLVVWMGAEPEVVIQGTRYLRAMTPGLFFMWMSTVLTGALRGAGDTRTPMKVNIMISVLNFVLNLILVYGFLGIPAMGVLGAGLATSMARITGGALIYGFYLAGHTVIPPKLKYDFCWDKPAVLKTLRVGLPAAGERVLMSSSSVLYQRMVAGLGTVSYAAHTIGINAESISYMPGQAFAVAATTLVGQSLGAKDPEKAERSTYESLKLACLLVSLMGAVFYFWPDVLMGAYTSDPDVIRLGSVYLRIMAFCQIHQAFGFVLTGGLRGAGDTKFPMIVTAVAAWPIRLVMTHYLINVVRTGVEGAWWAMAADGLFKGVASFIWFRMGRWKRTKE